ncbi:MAG: RHS repeat-associated core domain-containing protein [Luteolibacter sp.]|uniref:RHS repeat domain-containing protein n=1 Tax=Luteolibacter sp. TaxID=1962973 RepID=UPI003264BEC6
MKFTSILLLGLCALALPSRAQTTSAAAISELMAAVKERHDAAEDAYVAFFKLNKDYHDMMMSSEDVAVYSDPDYEYLELYGTRYGFRDEFLKELDPPKFEFDLIKDDYNDVSPRPAAPYTYDPAVTGAQAAANLARTNARAPWVSNLATEQAKTYTAPDESELPYDPDYTQETYDYPAYQKARWEAWVTARKAWIEANEIGDPPIPNIDREDYTTDLEAHPDCEARNDAFLVKDEEDWNKAHAAEVKRLERGLAAASGVVMAVPAGTSSGYSTTAWDTARDAWYEGQRMTAATAYKAACVAYKASLESTSNSDDVKRAREKLAYLVSLENSDGDTSTFGAAFQKAVLKWTYPSPSGADQELVALNEISRHLDRISQAYIHVGKIDSQVAFDGASLEYRADEAFLPLGIVTLENQASKVAAIQERLRQLDTLRWPMLLRRYDTPATVDADTIDGGARSVDLGEGATEAYSANEVGYLRGPDVGLYSPRLEAAKISDKAGWGKTLGRSVLHFDTPGKSQTVGEGYVDDISAIKAGATGQLYLASRIHSQGPWVLPTATPPLDTKYYRLAEVSEIPVRLGGSRVKFDISVLEGGEAYVYHPSWHPSDNKITEADEYLSNLNYKALRQYVGNIADLGLPSSLPIPADFEEADEYDFEYYIGVSPGTSRKTHLPNGQYPADYKSLDYITGESTLLFKPTFQHTPSKPFALAALPTPQPTIRAGVEGADLGLEFPLPIVAAGETTAPTLVLPLCDWFGGVAYTSDQYSSTHGFWSHLQLKGDRSDLLVGSRQDPPNITSFLQIDGEEFSEGTLSNYWSFDPDNRLITSLTGSNGKVEITWEGHYDFTLKYFYNGSLVRTYRVTAGGASTGQLIAKTRRVNYYYGPFITYPEHFGEITVTQDGSPWAKVTIAGGQTDIAPEHDEFAKVEYFNGTSSAESTLYYVYEGDSPLYNGTVPISILTKRGAEPLIEDRLYNDVLAPPARFGLNLLSTSHDDWQMAYEEFSDESITTPRVGYPASWNTAFVGTRELNGYNSLFLSSSGGAGSEYLPRFRYPKMRTMTGTGWTSNGRTFQYDHAGNLTNEAFKVGGLNAVRTISRGSNSITDTTVVAGTTLKTTNTALSNGLGRVVTTEDGMQNTVDYYVSEAGGGLPWQVKSVATQLGSTSYSYTKSGDGDLTTVETFNPDAPGLDTVTTTKVNKFGVLVSSVAKRGSTTVSSATATGHSTNAFRRPTSIAFFSGGVTRTQTFEYNNDGTLKTSNDGNGTIDQFQWDVLGRIKSGTTLDGHSLTATYAGLTNSFGIGGETISKQVDSYGKLKEFTNTAGSGLKVTKEAGETYDTSATNDGNRGFSQTYSPDGFPTVAGGGAGAPGESVSYDVATVNGKGCIVITSTLVSEESATPSVTKRYIDGFGRLVRVEEPHPMGTGTVHTDYAYNVAARTVTITPPSPSAPIVTTYDPGWMKAVTTQGSISREVSTTSSGATTTLSVKNAGREVYSQQVALDTGAVTSKVNGRNSTTATPTPNGNRVNISGPNLSYHADYDRYGMTGTAGTIRGQSFDSSVGRDANGQVATMSANPPGPKGSTTYSFAKTGRVTGAHGPGQDLSVAYNFAGGGVKATGTDTTNHKDFIAAEGAEGQPLRLAITGKNDLSVEGNALNGSNTLLAAGFGTQEVHYTYGPQGHLLGMTRPDGSSIAQTWRADGSLASVTRADSAGSNTFTMARDAATGYPSGYATATSSLAMAPNTDGTIASSVFTSKDIDNQSQTYSVSYPSYFDDSPLVESFGGSLSGYEVRRNYNATTGEISRVELRKNSAVVHAVDYTPDGYSQIGTVTASGSGSFSATYSHPSDNSETVTAGAAVATRTSLADGSGRLSSVSTSAGGNAWSATYGFGGQNRNSLTLVAPAQPSTTWTYTFLGTGGIGQLQTASSDQGMSYTYNHDAAGKRTGATANNANQYTVFQVPGAQTYTVAGKVVPGATVKIAANGAAPQSVPVAADGTFTGSFATTANSTSSSSSSVPVEVVATLPGGGDAGANAIAADQRNVVLPPGNWSNTYGAHGALASDWRWIYSYDPEGRLIGMTTQVAAASAGMPRLKLKFAYDDEGRRIGKTVQYFTATGATQRKVETKFIYDEWRLLAEESTDTATTAPVLTFYTWGKDIAGTLGETGGVGGLLGIHRNGASYVPVYDANGNVSAIVHSTTGAKVAAWTRGPFGEPISDSGATGLCPFGFATHYTDVETGLVYFGHRFYSPATGRWLSREPLGETESFNLYAYCHNDPVNGVDVLGLETIIEPNGLPTLIAESDGTWGIYLPTVKRRGNHAWDRSAPFRVGAMGDVGAGKFLRGELSAENLALWRQAGNTGLQAVDADQDVQSLKTVGMFVPGFGAGIEFADGNNIKGAAYFGRDVLLTVTGTKFLMGAKTLGSIALRSAAVGGAQGFTSASIDVGAGRGQAAWNGETYGQGLGDDAWDIAKATAGGAVIGGVLGPVGRLVKLKPKVASPDAGFFENVAQKATRNPQSSKLVLGKYIQDGKSYVKVAAHYKATYFKVENWGEVTRGLSQHEIWNINETFLRQQIQQGKQIILSHDPATATGFFALEVDFLEQMSYKFVEDNWVWKAVR